MSQERIFRIGTAAVCEIVIPDGIPANVVWAHLAVHDEGMHLLTIVEHGIACSVNGNAVSQQYWVNEEDVIEIEGLTLNWDYIRGDSNVPFKVNARRTFPKKRVFFISVAVIAVCVGLYYLLFYSPAPPPHFPTVSELFQNACDSASSINADEVKSGYEQIEKLAIDSLYPPAVLKHYEIVLSAKDTLRWDAVYNCMQLLSKDTTNIDVMYECALCMSYISPKLALPEVQQYDFVSEKNYKEANRLFEIVIRNDPYNYKAPFWALINLITLFNGKSLAESDSNKFEELYVLLDRNLSKSTEDLAVQYRKETERVIITILKNWQIID